MAGNGGTRCEETCAQFEKHCVPGERGHIIFISISYDLHTVHIRDMKIRYSHHSLNFFSQKLTIERCQVS